MLKGFKHDVKYPRRFTEKMKNHLDAVRPKKGHPGLVNLNGRPTKAEIVKRYREVHPEASKYRCAKDTGLDPKTVRRWWEA